MINKEKIYCLDANVLIQPWVTYYSPKHCLDYWDILNQFGAQGKIFIPSMVYEEIVRTEDDLSKWLKKSKIQVVDITESVTEKLSSIYKHDPSHKFLVDNTKARSLADPWVIAHAMDKQAVVVTKEEKITASNSTKIKIPNVCDNMKVPWINDFQLIQELNIKFSCHI